MKNNTKKTWVLLLSLVLLFSAFSVSVYAQDDLYLSDIKSKITSYSGLDNLLGIDTAHSGDKIKIGNTQFDKGLGIHCNPADPTYIEFDISAYSYKFLKAQLGMQSYSKDGVFLDWGSAVFMIYGDGKLLYTSSPLAYGEEPALAVVDISGVKKLRLENSNNGGYSCDWCIWGDIKMSDNNEGVEITTEEKKTTADFPQTDAVKASKQAYISDMVWGEWSNYGDTEPVRDGNHYNEEIWCGGNFYAKGIGMHANNGGSYIELNLEGCGFTTFYSLCMVSDSFSPYNISMASVSFSVYGDGKELCKTDTVRYNQTSEIKVDITGVKVLKLLIDPTPDGISGDWGTWANALVCNGEPVAPETTNITTEPAASETASINTDTNTEPAQTASLSTDAKKAPETTVNQTETSGNKLSVSVIVGICVGVAALTVVGIIFGLGRKKK